MTLDMGTFKQYYFTLYINVSLFFFIYLERGYFVLEALNQKLFFF